MSQLKKSDYNIKNLIVMQKARGPKLSPLKLDEWTGHLCRSINRLRHFTCNSILV